MKIKKTLLWIWRIFLSDIIRHLSCLICAIISMIYFGMGFGGFAIVWIVTEIIYNYIGDIFLERVCKKNGKKK